MEYRKKICKTCQEECYIFSAGRCLRCTNIEKAAKPLKKTEIKKKPYTLKRQTVKTKEKRAVDREGFGEFFIKHINIIKDENRRCENCQQPLRGNASEVAHILSKSKHLEVSTHDDNVVYLCGMFTDSGCHAEFDNTLSKRREMAVFSLAVEKYKLIQHLIVKQSSESRQFEEYLTKK